MKQASRRRGAATPAKAPIGQHGENCRIVFGFNAATRQVLMQFSVMAERLVFSAEDADHVAAQLTHHAMLARGGKAS